jgi:hypothetical protein
MNNALLIQHCSGSIHARMLAVFYARHVEYCIAHKFDYWALMDGRYPVMYSPWARVPLILDALGRGYQYIVAMDTDAYIHDLSADLREACPPVGFGACIHDANDVPRHYNIGVLYVTRSAQVREFCEHWLLLYPGYDNMEEQTIFNNLVSHRKYAGIVQQIDDKYNSTIGTNESPAPVVVAWHGVGTTAERLALMQTRALELTGRL